MKSLTGVIETTMLKDNRRGRTLNATGFQPVIIKKKCSSFVKVFTKVLFGVSLAYSLWNHSVWLMLEQFTGNCKVPRLLIKLQNYPLSTGYQLVKKLLTEYCAFIQCNVLLKYPLYLLEVL